MAPRGRHDGKLDVTCWCEREMVAMTPEDIALGLTASCDGEEYCKPRCHSRAPAQRPDRKWRGRKD